MILVTGGAGFIGANFVLDWLERTGEPVVNLDKLTYAGNLGSLGALRGDSRHVFVRGDIGDLDYLLCAGDAPDNGLRSELRRLNHLRIRLHVALECHDFPVIVIVSVHEAESGFANPHRVYQHCVEYRFKITGRA